MGREYPVGYRVLLPVRFQRKMVSEFLGCKGELMGNYFHYFIVKS